LNTSPTKGLYLVKAYYTYLTISLLSAQASIRSKKKETVEFYLEESASSFFADCLLSKLAKESQDEFSAVKAPVLSLSWLPNREANDKGLWVELAFLRPCIVLIAARVLR